MSPTTIHEALLDLVTLDEASATKRLSLIPNEMLRTLLAAEQSMTQTFAKAVTIAFCELVIVRLRVATVHKSGTA